MDKFSRKEYHIINKRIKLIRKGVIQEVYLIPKEPAIEASIRFNNFIKDYLNDNRKTI